jgi:hypothetical protein
VHNVQTRRDFLKTGLLAIPGLILAARSRGAVTEFSLPAMDLEFIEAKIKLRRRWEWGQTQPKTSFLSEASTYDRLTIHHSGSVVEDSSESAVGDHLEGIVTGHIERGYGDIGYHFMIDAFGRVWEGRSLAYEGAHVFGQNERNIGVMLLGNFEEQWPTREQVASMRQLVPLLCDRYRIEQGRVYGHRDLGQSVCPGRNLYSYVVKLREQGAAT